MVELLGIFKNNYEILLLVDQLSKAVNAEDRDNFKTQKIWSSYETVKRGIVHSEWQSTINKTNED